MAKFNYYLSHDWKRKCKRDGTADASVKECLNVKRDTSVDVEQRRKLTKKIADKMYSDNVIQHFPSYMKKYGLKK